MQSIVWNPWHGCTKYSPGCEYCYVYRRDGSVGRDASEVTKNKTFGALVETKKNGGYKIPSGTHVYACMTSDFFLDKADIWRADVWKMIKQRSDLKFTIITKRILRFEECIPDDWGGGYDNVCVVCTVENQNECDKRLPVFMKLPIKHKQITCEPLLGKIDLSRYLDSTLGGVVVGGESGNNARICDYSWVLDIRKQCIDANVGFYFKQTGAKFLKDGKIYNVPRSLQHIQAKRADINTVPDMGCRDGKDGDLLREE